MQAKRGLLVVISAPSGGGKTTVIHEILKTNDDLFQYSISATTRKPRGREQDGVDYYFISEEEFKRRIEASEFIEWARVHGHYYGTPKKPIDDAISSGKIIFLDIDVQGGLEVKKKYGDDALLIFIMPPSIEELEKRLRGRKTESDEEIARRLAAVPVEIEKSKYYDAVVVNNDLSETVRKVKDMIYKTYQAKAGGSRAHD
ncbi:MAG: guanylate kinase [candidate division KSB1 bacterium]|nr:guanylate kinase [candidate division KSB1 bacterium]MDQ7063109.1 guanylate kinase [candidate division KSB1 bacterium]